MAYIVSSRVGLMPGSAAYIRGYAEEFELEDLNVEVITKAAARIERLADISYGGLQWKQ